MHTPKKISLSELVEKVVHAAGAGTCHEGLSRVTASPTICLLPNCRSFPPGSVSTAALVRVRNHFRVPRSVYSEQAHRPIN